MNCSPAAREAKRIGLPKADRTLKWVSNLARARCRLQRSNMHAEFPRQCCKWQEFASPLLRCERLASLNDDVRRRAAEAPIPHAERVHGNREQISQFPLCHLRIPPKRSQRVHTHTLPSASFDVKRPPEYQAGDQRQF
jgi:hypothetical protein